MEAQRLAFANRRRFFLDRPSPLLIVLFLFQFPVVLNAAEKFRAASGGFGTAIHAVLWAAYHKNIYQKYDLDAEYIAIQSGTTGMQMLLSGEVQCLFSGGPQPINANLQGADVTIFAGGLDFFPYKLIARPEIKNANQLKSKNLGITSFGSVTELATRMALEKLGVNPKQVTIVQVGGSLNRYAALQGGSIQGTVMFEPLASMAVRNLGMNSLIDMAESGLTFRDQFLHGEAKLSVNKSN